MVRPVGIVGCDLHCPGCFDRHLAARTGFQRVCTSMWRGMQIVTLAFKPFQFSFMFQPDPLCNRSDRQVKACGAVLHESHCLHE